MIVNSKQSAKDCYIKILEMWEKEKFIVVKFQKTTRLDVQNSWIQQFYTMVSKQQGNPRNELVRHCKLKFGMSILLRDELEALAVWRKMMGKLNEYEQLVAMDHTRVTSLFKVDECSEYIQELISVYVADFELPEKQWRDK